MGVLCLQSPYELSKESKKEMLLNRSVGVSKSLIKVQIKMYREFLIIDWTF